MEKRTIDLVKADLEELELAVNKIGNYSGCYLQKVAIFDCINKLRKDINIPRETIRQLTKAEIEKELGCKIEIVD